MSEDKEKQKKGKWEFADYAYTITGILVGVLLVMPELLESLFGISVLGGSLSEIAPDLVEGMEDGQGLRTWNINQLRALSPLLFLLTTAIVFFQEAFAVRKNGTYKGSMFTHTFESLFEEAIYMTITTVMVYAAVLFGAMYMSWLAGPITWVLFIFIFPFVRKKSSGPEIEEVDTPWLLLFLLGIGLIVELITGAWIALPVSWLIICVIKLVETIRERDDSIDRIFNILYYAFSVVLMGAGVGWGYWITSWAAFPIALLICWIVNKFGRFKKVEADQS